MSRNNQNSDMLQKRVAKMTSFRHQKVTVCVPDAVTKPLQKGTMTEVL